MAARHYSVIPSPTVVMSEAATLGVIRDLFALAGIALVIALIVYEILRAGGGPQWNCEGNVLTRPYDQRDGMAALLLIVFFAWNSSVGGPDSSAHEASSSSGGEVQEGVLLLGMLFM